MTYKTLDTINTSEGIHTLFTYANDVTGNLLMPMILFAFFIIVCIAGYHSQKRLTGRGDFPAMFAVAGYVTFGFALLLSLIPNLISPIYLIVTLAVSFAGTVWLLFARS